jgi:hypothetical protein
MDTPILPSDNPVFTSIEGNPHFFRKPGKTVKIPQTSGNRTAQFILMVIRMEIPDQDAESKIKIFHVMHKIHYIEAL